MKHGAIDDILMLIIGYAIGLAVWGIDPLVANALWAILIIVVLAVDHGVNKQ